MDNDWPIYWLGINVFWINGRIQTHRVLVTGRNIPEAAIEAAIQLAVIENRSQDIIMMASKTDYSKGWFARQYSENDFGTPFLVVKFGDKDE